MRMNMRHKDLTAEEAADDAGRTVVKMQDTVARDEHTAVAFVALTALFAFVTWTALRANASSRSSASKALASCWTRSSRASAVSRRRRTSASPLPAPPRRWLSSQSNQLWGIFFRNRWNGLHWTLAVQDSEGAASPSGVCKVFFISFPRRQLRLGV